MDLERTGRIFGWFFIATFVASIPARLLIIDGFDARWTDAVFNPGVLSETKLRLGDHGEWRRGHFAGRSGRHPGVALRVGVPVRARTRRRVRQRFDARLHHVPHRPRPPRLAILGLVGGPLLIISFVLITFGAYENGSTPSGLMAVPEIAWEASLAVYAAWKGFRNPSIGEPRAPTA